MLYRVTDSIFFTRLSFQATSIVLVRLAGLFVTVGMLGSMVGILVHHFRALQVHFSHVSITPWFDTITCLPECICAGLILLLLVFAARRSARPTAGIAVVSIQEAARA